LGVRNSCETHKTAPVLVFGEEFEWTRDVVSKGAVEMKDWVKRIALVGLFFFSLTFGQIIGCSLLHETLFFFHFFFTFEINSLVWSIYWKTFYFISFEALSKQHVWNFRWLRRGWMRWRGPTRELTQFDLVLGHQVCLGLPQLLMTWKKWYGLQKLT